MPGKENKASLLSKSIKKAPKRLVNKTGALAKNKNTSKVGMSTSQRMQDKIQQQKTSKKAKNDDEEIHSESSDGGDFDVDKKKKKESAANELMDDPFLKMDEEETVEEKRLRMTQQIIKEYQQPTEEKKDFFENLQVKAHMEEAIMEADDDQITRRMKMHLLEQKGKLFYSIADDFWATGEDHFEKHFIKGHKKAITCMQWMPDSRSIITGSKDCSLIQWDLESESKTFFRGMKFDKNFPGHNDEVVCCAVSPNGKYLVSGGKDRLVRVWDIHNQTQIKSFMGHRDTITDVCFDTENDQFYTVSNDRALKVWNLREMTYMDSHYGHHANIGGLDAYTKDRVISCGMDRQVIFWKISEDSELLYKNQQHSADTINVINNQFFLTGSHDNCIDLWIMNKKKPTFTMDNLHDNDSWILSTANVRNSDLFTSGSYDGNVNFYKLHRDKKNFSLLGKINGLNGCINTMKFSHHSRASGSELLKQQKMQRLMLAVSHSKDEKDGRWHPQAKVKHGITIIKKKQV